MPASLNSPFIWFLGISLLIVVALWLFFKGAIINLKNAVAEHAAVYAVAYAKGGALAFISATNAFAAGYAALPEPMKASMPWAPYAIFFSLPIDAALGVAIAMVDQSVQRGADLKKTRADNGVSAHPFPDPAGAPAKAATDGTAVLPGA